MKKVIVLLAIWMVFVSCQKDEPTPPTKTLASFDWIWDARVPGGYLRPYLDPILYKNWVILPSKDYIDFSQDGPTLIAYDKRTGHVAWQYSNPNKTNAYLKNCKISGDRIILKYGDRLVCLHAETRAVIWETMFSPNDNISNDMEIYNDYLYQEQGYLDHPSTFPFSDSISLVRYHLATGKAEKIYGERTKEGTDQYPELFPPVIYQDGQRELAIFQRYISYAKDRWPVDMVAVDIQTKEVVWRDTSYSPNWASRSTPPRILDGNVIAASDHAIYSWDATTGKRNWRKPLFTGADKISFTGTGPFIYDQKIFVFEFGGHGFCLNPQTGLTLWETYTHFPKDYGPSYGACLQPIIVDDIMLVNAGSNRTLVAYDARNGKVMKEWKDATYNGTNVLYDEETETCFVLADEKLRALKVRRL